MATKLPQLERFLKNPNYIDNGKYGKYRIDRFDYQRRYELLSDLFDDFPIHYFKEDDSSYYVLVTIPSERKGNTYDIVIHFFTNDASEIRSSSIRNYYIQIFSNNPVFGFHFAHANIQHGLVIPFLVDKFTTEMVNERAASYNPNDDVGYCQSFYHAGKYLLSKARYLNKGYIESRAMTFTPKNVSFLVKPITQTIEEYKAFKNRQALKNRLNKEKSISDKVGGAIDELKSKIGQGIDNARGKLDKITKSNFVGSSKPSVTRKTKSTSIGTKSAISKTKRISAKKKNF